jgi:hypothetical protein
MPGLFFIGEVVEVTGWLGGYNFQWAWASGHAAGQGVQDGWSGNGRESGFGGGGAKGVMEGLDAGEAGVRLVCRDVEGGANLNVCWRKVILVDEPLADLVRVIRIGGDEKLSRKSDGMPGFSGI